MAAVEDDPHHDHDRTDRDRGVGDVEERPGPELHEVDHRAVQERRSPEHAIAEVADRAAEDERETHDEPAILGPDDGPDEHHRGDDRDDREHGCARSHDAEIGRAHV